MQIEEEADEDTFKGERKSALKLPWSEEAVQEIRLLFEKEIEQKKVTMEFVKEKIKDSKVFQAKDARRVYDKVCAEWRHPVSKNNTLDLPTEKEKLSDKVERLFRGGTSASTDFVSSTIALSNNTKALFSEEDLTLLHRLFEDMLQNSPISKKVISDRLFSDAKGKSMLKSHWHKYLTALSMSAGRGEKNRTAVNTRYVLHCVLFKDCLSITQS